IHGTTSSALPAQLFPPVAGSGLPPTSQIPLFSDDFASHLSFDSRRPSTLSDLSSPSSEYPPSFHAFGGLQKTAPILHPLSTGGDVVIEADAAPWSGSSYSGYDSSWHPSHAPYYAPVISQEPYIHRPSVVDWDSENPLDSMSPVTGGAMPSWPGNFKSSTDTLSTSTSSDFGYKAYIPRVITTSSQTSSTVPSYAGSWDGSTVHDSGDETDAMFYEQPLDTTIGTRAKQNYINAYWRSFHPAFPILHKLTYQRKMPSPLLQAAIMAVGTHYSAEPHADGDAKVMQEKCNRLLANLRNDPENVTPITPINADKNSLDDAMLERQWQRWIRINTQQRLLLAAYILDCQQQLLFARPMPPPLASDVGLPFPASVSLWDTESIDDWCTLYRNEQYKSISTCDVLNTISAGRFPMQQLDQFQSAHLIATFSSPGSLHHSAFDAQNLYALEQTLNYHPSTRLYFNSVLLANLTPVRLLLAVSGESWVFSERLSHDASEADLIFTRAKAELRSW
ncbi:hypothetical protein LTS18_008271, partial [Coniosporium uncinatum]